MEGSGAGFVQIITDPEGKNLPDSGYRSSKQTFFWTNPKFLTVLDIADGLVGVGLITQSEDNPGFLTLDKGYNDMSKFLNRQDHHRCRHFCSKNAVISLCQV